MQTLHLVILVVALVGGVQLGVAAWLRRRTLEFLSRARRAPGRFTGEARSARTIAHGSTRYGVVEFTTARGEVRTVESRLGLPWRPRADSPVAVLYDPDDPSDAVLDRPMELWGVALIFGLGGAMTALIAITLVALDVAGVLPR